MDAIEECLNNYEDTYPFPTENFALLYLLLHSPRPMVCTLDSVQFNRFPIVYLYNYIG